MHDDLLSLAPRTDFTRREFVVTSLAAGFALAVQPVSAADHHDRHQGARGRRGEDPGRPTARSRPTARCPPSGGPFPVVLVVQEIFGVHEHIKDICRRLAKLGYLAVAPELYARQGDVSKIDGLPRDHLQGRLQGPRRAGDVRPRRDRRLGQGHRQGRHGEARHHRLLLGRPDRLAVRGPQPEPEGRRGLVRPAGRRRRRAAPQASRSTWSARLKAPVLGLYGGADQGIPVAIGREDARGPQGRRQDRPRSSSTPTRRTPSSPTTGPATARSRPRTAGSGCWSGSRSTAWPDSARHRSAPARVRAGRGLVSPGLRGSTAGWKYSPETARGRGIPGMLRDQAQRPTPKMLGKNA